MRDYGKVHTAFWASDTLRSLDADAKLLALYLLTSPHTNASGAFRLPDAYACDDLGWDSERLRNGFETLSTSGFSVRHESTGWVWVCKFGEWNKPDNPNIKKAILKAVEAIPQAVSFKPQVSAFWNGLSDGETFFGTVSEPLSNTPSPSPSLFPLLILDDGSEFEVSPEFAAECRSAYPKIDLVTELTKMRIWLVANPANRKTRRGITKFINGWLAKALPSASVTPIRKTRKELGV
jgi:hypothetical protein